MIINKVKILILMENHPTLLQNNGILCVKKKMYVKLLSKENLWSFFGVGGLLITDKLITDKLITDKLITTFFGNDSW